MSKNKEQSNIIKYPKQIHFPLGFIIIGVMCIYMVYHLFTYITANNVTVYEVSQGSISSNLEYNALALRSEQIVYADNSGSLLYLAENLSKVSVKSQVYALDQSGTVLSTLDSSSDSGISLDSDSINKLQEYITSFSTEYDSEDYNKVYSFKTELESRVEQAYNLSAINSMGALSDTSNSSLNIYNAPSPGLVVYSIDGYESMTSDDFTADALDTSKYSAQNLKVQESVNAGDPVYKLVTSDKWQLICEIDENLFQDLAEETYLQVEFLEDENTTWAAISEVEKDGKYYLIMDLDDSMDRYGDSRFVHIKLLQNNVSGLKIPNSSIVEKEFFTVPKEYFYEGGNNSSDVGLMLLGEDNTTSFITPTSYYETDDCYYIDDELVEKGDKILKADSSKTYTIGTDTDSLQGVYNVNKGYAVFKRIEILYQNADYSIIKTGTSYGISMYDHIVLQGNQVTENTIINQ